MNTSSFEITRYKNGVRERLVDYVVCECIITIVLNNKEIARLVCLNSHLYELAVGYLFAEGFIKSNSEITSFYHNENENRYELFTSATPKASTPAPPLVKGSGLGAPCFSPLSALTKISSSFTISAALLIENIAAFNQSSALFNTTGGVHSCSLFYKDTHKYFCEDIGRHNAIDKALGHSLIDGLDLSQCYLITSGRIPTDMVHKAVRCKIPIVVSRSAPTDKSIELARSVELTLCGFARENRMNIYSGEFRIT